MKFDKLILICFENIINNQHYLTRMPSDQMPRIVLPPSLPNMPFPCTLSSLNSPAQNYPLESIILPKPDLVSCDKSPKFSQYFTLVVLPVELNIFEVLVVELFRKFLCTVIKNLASSMKLISVPLALVCDVSGIVEQFSVAIHHILFPLTLIITTIFVIECSLPISLAIVDKTDISSAVLVDLL